MRVTYREGGEGENITEEVKNLKETNKQNSTTTVLMLLSIITFSYLISFSELLLKTTST